MNKDTFDQNFNLGEDVLDQVSSLHHTPDPDFDAELMELLGEARRRGVKTILITHFPNSPGAALADVVLLCGADESPLQLGSVGARIAQLYLLDILFSELCRRNLDQCRESRSHIAKAMEVKHL